MINGQYVRMYENNEGQGRNSLEDQRLQSTKVFIESSPVFHVTTSKELWMLANVGYKICSYLQTEVSKNFPGIRKIKAP